MASEGINAVTQNPRFLEFPKASGPEREGGGRFVTGNTPADHSSVYVGPAVAQRITAEKAVYTLLLEANFLPYFEKHPHNFFIKVRL